MTQGRVAGVFATIEVAPGRVIFVRVNRNAEVEILATESIGKVAIPAKAVPELRRVLKQVAKSEK